MSEKVLVTGANGLVGRRLCEQLANRGYRVFAGVRELPFVGAEHPQITPLPYGDLTNLPTHAFEHLGISAVVHSAARVHVMKETADCPYEAYRRANVEATKRLAEASYQAGVKQFIFLSTIKVNGEVTTDTPFKASDKPNPDGPYSESKWGAEAWLREYCPAHELKYVCIRPPLIYGPGVKGNFQRLMNWIKNNRILPLGSIKNARAMIAVDNLCDLIEAAVANPAVEGTFLAADAHHVGTVALIQTMSETLGQPARLVRFPLPLLKLMMRLMGRAEQLERLNSNLVLDIEATKAAFGWTPKLTLQEAMGRYFK